MLHPHPRRQAMHACINLAVSVHRMGAKADRQPGVALGCVGLGWGLRLGLG